MACNVSCGFAEHERHEVASLYWHAFSGKLGRVLGPADRALAFVSASLDPSFALVARDDAGMLLGVAGFKTADGALMDGDVRGMLRVYGIGALWRTALLALVLRPVEPRCLLMDGIFVADKARGRGVGTALLDAIKAHAVALDKREVRLDVIDINPRARALYEREGFVAQRTESLGPLRAVFGFASATEMRWCAGGRDSRAD